jgi:hypothetical protein
LTGLAVELSRRARWAIVNAAASRSLECLRLLVDERGVRAGRHAVEHAICWGRLDCLAYLIERPPRLPPPPRVSWRRRRAYICAADFGELECLRYLCERARREGRDPWARSGGWRLAGQCCLSALGGWRQEKRGAWPARGVSCIRYVVACSGVSARDVGHAAEKAADAHAAAVRAFSAALVCAGLRMHERHRPPRSIYKEQHDNTGHDS